jgi:hypothetical protein
VRSLALLLLIPGLASACDSLNLGLISHHWDRDQGYNERHSGLGCTNAFGRWDVLYFRNSNERDSFALFDYKQVRQYGRLTLGYDYGLVTGYDWPITPVILPKAQYEIGAMRLNGYILLTEGVALGLEFDL